MVTKDLGMVTAYAYAVSKGYTGTETQFAELMASYATVGQQAVDAALAAAQSAQDAASARDTAQTTVAGAIAGIQAEGQTQIGAVQAEGTTQVGNVNTAGTTQVWAVQAKGTEVINSIPSDYTELSDDVSGLKSQISAKINASLAGIREYQDKTRDFVIGKYITTGAVGSVIDLNTEVNGAATTRTTSYCLFDVNEGDKVYFTGQSIAGTGSRCMSMVRADGTVLLTSASETAAKTWEMVAPENCKCLIVALTWTSAAGYLQHLTTVISDDHLARLESEVGENSAAIEPLRTTDGWYSLDTSLFTSGGWKSYSSTENRPYRVRTKSAISFTRNVHILAKPGYCVVVWFEDGWSDVRCCVDVKANTPCKIYIRRLTEDTSETADVATFVSMMLISSGLSGIERYASTFTDVTMFPRIGISGDSYSAGGGIISGIRELTWGKNLERESGVTVDIYAKSGEAITAWNVDATNGLPALLAGEECGLYWFAHGINGTSTDEVLGTPADMSADPKPQTFYGQYVYAIEAVKTAFPNARIVIATIMGTGYRLYQTTYAKVNTAIRNIAEYCQVPVVDLADDDFYKSAWYDDHHLSSHPTAMLNAGIAHANRRILAKCIMENTDYFINYGNRQ